MSIQYIDDGDNSQLIEICCELAHRLTCDELLIYPEFPDYDDEDDLYEEAETSESLRYKESVQDIFNKHYNLVEHIILVIIDPDNN